MAASQTFLSYSPSVSTLAEDSAVRLFLGLMDFPVCFPPLFDLEIRRTSYQNQVLCAYFNQLTCSPDFMFLDCILPYTYALKDTDVI